MSPEVREAFRVELADFLKSSGLIIVPKTVFESTLVNGIPRDVYRANIIKKPLLSCKEIADAHLWGPIGKHAVKAILKKEKLEDHLVRVNGTIKLPRSIVRNIALQRGCAVG